MIVTTRNKEMNLYDVYYDNSTVDLFSKLDYNNNLGINLGQWAHRYKDNKISKFLIVKIAHKLELIKYATALPRREEERNSYYVVNALLVKEWKTGFDFENKNMEEYNSNTFERIAFPTKEECKKNIISRIKEM